ncbi:putative lipopolysaccharide heptosyltransferase III [Chromobacterium sp. ASV23]|uniref:putative lipopolysaccharide heptosyltransferase III n=1 Tax=Chromobacterium sp. ASV23 TaxID=2795110 RepID=UPI0018EA639B|nr:putative lipopolysaccharide heptosyltransferase III [Chromobacterium sp. ASV23]
MLNDPIALSDVRRALVIKLRHHGDVLLTSPVFSALQAAAPQLEIDALVYHDTREMLSLHPAISELHTIDRGWKKLGLLGQLRAEWGLFSRLKARRYDLVITLTEHNRGAWLSRWLKPRWSVGPSGPYGRFFKKSFSHRYLQVPGNRRHTIEIHLDALRRIGVYPAAEQRGLTLVPGANAEATLAAKLAERGLQPGRYILVHPTSRWSFKSWPEEKMAALIDALSARGEQVVLSAAPSGEELAMVAEIEKRLARPVASLAGLLSLKELAAAIDHARLYIGVDSVPMHIASAMKTPCVALFGPSGDIEWGPWQVPHRIVSEPVPCRPCGNAGCGGGWQSECLQRIPLERVLVAVDAVLKETQ